MLAVPAGGFEQLCSLLQAVGGSEVQLRSREKGLHSGRRGGKQVRYPPGPPGEDLAAAGGRWLCSAI